MAQKNWGCPADQGEEASVGSLQVPSPSRLATGFPLEVEGFVTDRYCKTPPVGVTSIRARNGVVVR